MGTNLAAMGFFRWPLAVSLGLVALLGLWAAFRLVRDGSAGSDRTRVWVDAVLFWGAFAAINGVVGGLVGVVRIVQAWEAVGQVAMVPPAARGVVMATLTPIAGFSILAVAALLWFFLQLRWRLTRS